MAHRQIVLDTETTGLNSERGDRIIEIAAVELINHVSTGRVFHKYVNPQIIGEMPEEAYRVHGLTTEFLSDKPIFSEIADELLTFIGESKIVIHNAKFDTKFLNDELRRIQENNPNKHITIDSIREFRELTEIKLKSKQSGLLMIGGGVPKNFIQDTVVCAELLGKKVDMHKYAIQITVADTRDGACSSSTLKEASSWGKVDITKEQMVFAEATSVLPLIASDAYHRANWKKRSKRNFSQIFKS